MSTETLERHNAPVYRTFEVRAPESMGFVYEVGENNALALERDALALYPYIVRGQISNGRAAEILGMGKWDLVSWYESQGLMVMSTSVEEFLKDMDTLDKLGV